MGPLGFEVEGAQRGLQEEFPAFRLGWCSRNTRSTVVASGGSGSGRGRG